MAKSNKATSSEYTGTASHKQPRPRKQTRVRLDEELVAQGFFTTQEAAARAVMAGDVSTSDRRLEHPGEQVPKGIELHVRMAARYVSRGGIKLAHALEVFSVDVRDKTCIDIGCSTGGFTDCLLQHGAAHVTAVDVGYAQFSYRLRRDERIRLLERTNIRDLDTAEHHGHFNLAVCDVSFVAASSLIDCIARLLCDGGQLVVLVKPQFELPESCIGQGGVVRNKHHRAQALAQVIDAAHAAGLQVQGACASPITGAKGNHEYLLYAQRNTQTADAMSQAKNATAPASTIDIASIVGGR